MSKNLKVPQEEIAAFCQRYHIRRFSLFGSVLRDDFRPDSDVDVLIELEPGHGVGFFTLFHMEEELAGILGVSKVDLNTPLSLSERFRDKVMAGAEVHYAPR